MASAKLANSTVNHSHSTIWNSKPRLLPPLTRSRKRMTVVNIVTTSSTKMTGFLISVRGSSLRTADAIAGQIILATSKAETGIPLRVIELSMATQLQKLIGPGQPAGGRHPNHPPAGHTRRRREAGRPAKAVAAPGPHPDNGPAPARKGPHAGCHGLFGPRGPREGVGRDAHPDGPDQRPHPAG